MRRLNVKPEPSSAAPFKKIRALGKSESGVPWWQTSKDAEPTQSLTDTDITTSSEKRRGVRPPREISPIESPVPPAPPPALPAPPPAPPVKPVPPSPVRPVPRLPVPPLPPPEIIPPPEYRPVIPPEMRYPPPEEEEEEEEYMYPRPPAPAPCPQVQEMEMAILRECLIQKIKSIEFYLEMAESVKGDLCEFFLCKAKDEIEHFKLLLGMLGHLDSEQADELESSDLQDCMVMAMDFCCHRSDMMWGEERSPEFTEGGHWEDDDESDEEDDDDDDDDDDAETMRMRMRMPMQRPHYFPPYKFFSRPIEPIACYREQLARAVKIEANMITFLEEQMCQVNNCDIRNLLACIIMHEKKDLAQFSQQLLKTFPES